MGFDDYLTKPVDGTLLENMICNYLPEEKIEVVERVDDISAEAESCSELIKALNEAGS